jgi:hypothetical protein
LDHHCTSRNSRFDSEPVMTPQHTLCQTISNPLSRESIKRRTTQKKTKDKMDDDGDNDDDKAKKPIFTPPPPPYSSSWRDPENGENQSMQRMPGAVPSSPSPQDRASLNKNVVRREARRSSNTKNKSAPLELAPALALDAVDSASLKVPPMAPGAVAASPHQSSPQGQATGAYFMPDGDVRQRLSNENKTHGTTNATISSSAPNDNQISQSEEEKEENDDVPGAFASSSSPPRETRRAKRHLGNSGKGRPWPVQKEQGMNEEEGLHHHLAEGNDPWSHDVISGEAVEPIQRVEDDNDNDVEEEEEDVEIAFDAFVVTNTTLTEEERRAALLKIAENAPLVEVLQEQQQDDNANNHQQQRRRKSHSWGAVLLFLAVFCVIIIAVPLVIVNHKNQKDSNSKEKHNIFSQTGTPTATTAAAGLVPTSTPSQKRHPTELPSGAPSTSQVPTMTPTTSAPTSDTLAIVASLIFDNPEQDRPRDPTSPQWKALQWLAEEDGVFQNLIRTDNGTASSRKLVLSNTTTSNTTTKQLVRRYALATLYYATNGDS